MIRSPFFEKGIGLFLRFSISDLKNRVAAVCVIQNSFLFAGGWGGGLNMHETTHSRFGGNGWFLHFVGTNALLAP